MAVSALITPSLETPRSPRAVMSYGPLVSRWAEKRLGIIHGPWQEYALGRMLECDDEGDLIARLVLLSVARQNGKSVIVRSICGWIMDEGWRLDAFRDWTFLLLAAHDAKQARIPYDFIRRDLMSFADVSAWGQSARRVGKAASRATMYTGLELNGVRVDVATRQPGSARGVSPGLICFDEVLTQTDFSMYEVLSPAQSAIRNSQMLMTSTMGYADSVVLRSMYDRLYRQATGAERADETFLGLCWQADDDEVGLDWARLKMANPALDDGRLSRQSIEAEYAVLPKGSWVRERLNRWHDERVDAPFTLAEWGACRQVAPLDPEDMAPETKYTIAVDVTPNWSEGSIIVAGQRRDERVGVEVHRYLQARPDVPLTADAFMRECDKLVSKLRVEQIVYANSNALAAAMERYSIMKQVPVVAVTSSRNMVACHDFAEAVMHGRIAHDDPHLDAQVASAQRRFIGKDGQWRWSISQAPITSVVGMTLATMYAMKAVMPLQLF